MYWRDKMKRILFAALTLLMLFSVELVYEGIKRVG